MAAAWSLTNAVADGRAADIPSVSSPLRFRTGGGNLETDLAGAGTRPMIDALAGVGARLGRMDSYGWRDLARRPTPHDFDRAMAEAYAHGITPVVLLEYEGSYQFLHPPQPIGSYGDWFAAGQAYARRFRPGGDWAREHAIPDWGATVFAAINEPDVQATIPRAAYRDALAGLADGVHSVDPALRVVPGGFATCNSHGDGTLRGYGSAIAGLFDDGRLDGLDLHTYYNARWYPLEQGQRFSAQACFDQVKAASGIHRDINFYATEYNVAREGAWSDPAVAARLFLTALWDEISVVRADGSSPATVLALPWNLADTGSIEGPAYAMATSVAPWSPDPRGAVVRTVLSLAGDMRMVAIDRHAGTVKLEGNDRQLLVWQDLPGWTDTPATRWQVSLPPWAQAAELWAWDGLRRTLSAHGGVLEIDDLPGHETYMLLIR